MTTFATTQPGDHHATDEPDDGLTCDPCKEWRCHECEGGACWHECPEDGDDPAESRRYLSGPCWAGNCGECTDRACEHDCGHEASDVDHSQCDWGWKKVKCDRCGTEFTCTPSKDFYCTPEGDHCCEPCLQRPPKADHPHTDPRDGRTECDVCGKYVWPVIHSCKGIPVTPAARQRWEARRAASRD